ncbi:hypothetical protein SOV_38880 [Sporomusa ovata DSM 2662]|uniref:hypothetical protein n=1 Tax=Sporomusa ovata TaxID=2378 RepID=UPI0003887D13|nr:hypothetical protein [Sporomusa ovata]EQB26276.1 hypothetical protein SOV_3c01500 [Sporomusa ovata DSM 2662]
MFVQIRFYLKEYSTITNKNRIVTGRKDRTIKVNKISSSLHQEPQLPVSEKGARIVAVEKDFPKSDTDCPECLKRDKRDDRDSCCFILVFVNRTCFSDNACYK